MSSVEFLRGFVSDRLSAAAEEIFGVFKRTIIEYEEEISRQRRLLDIAWKPHVHLQRIEVLEKEQKVLSELQLCTPERIPSLDQEDPDPPQIKIEPEELCTNLESEQLELKQEPGHFELTLPHEDSDLIQPKTNRDHQLLTHSSEDQEQGSQGDSKLQSSTSSSPDLSENLSNPDTVKKTFKCETCGDVFRYHSELLTHQRVHKGLKIFTCKSCGKMFRFISLLESHVRVHTGEKPFVCKVCGRAFSFSYALKLHMRTHTGDKPFACSTCGKKFCRRANLKNHVQIHTGERPFVCETCGKSFRLKGSYAVHLRTHTGENSLPCSFCGKPFYKMSDLNRHVRIHTGEKPYTCKTCGKSFRTTCNLSDHRRTHTGEKAYNCKACGKGFSHSRVLKSHLLSCEQSFIHRSDLSQHSPIKAGEKTSRGNPVGDPSESLGAKNLH